MAKAAAERPGNPPENRLTPSVLSIGDDIGIKDGPGSGSLRRHLEYARRCRLYVGLCYTAPGFKPRHIGGNFHLYPTNTRRFPFFILDALVLGRRLIRRWDPEVIVTQDALVFGLAGYLLKRISGLPLVVHYHSGFWTNPHWLSERGINPLLAGLGRFVTGRADLVRTVSTDIREGLLREGFDPARVLYATPPVESEPFLKESRDKERDIISRLGLTPSRTFLFVGRLSREKNLGMMLRVAAELSGQYPDLKLLMIGGGPEEGALREEAAGLGISDRVIFLGPVPNGELNAYMRASCALLISSNYEGTAKVIKEAAFAGRPSISTRTSGVSDAVKDGETGLVVPIGDKRAFAGAMDLLLRDPEKALAMGERARAFMLKTFVFERDVDRLVDIWQMAASRRGR